MKWNSVGLALFAATALTTPSMAHHSFAMFDADNPITVTGTVKEFEWTNPHSWLRIMVQDKASGKAMQWALEMGAPVAQERVGWKSDSIKAGDKVTVTFLPLKDGSRGGGLLSATLPDGRTLSNGGLDRPNVQHSARFPGGLPAGIYGQGK